MSLWGSNESEELRAQYKPQEDGASRKGRGHTRRMSQSEARRGLKTLPLVMEWQDQLLTAGGGSEREVSARMGQRVQRAL